MKEVMQGAAPSPQQSPMSRFQGAQATPQFQGAPQAVVAPQQSTVGSNAPATILGSAIPELQQNAPQAIPQSFNNLVNRAPVQNQPTEADIDTQKRMAEGLAKYKAMYLTPSYRPKPQVPYVPTQTTYNKSGSPPVSGGYYPAGFVPKSNPLKK